MELKSMLLLHSDETECARLREKWAMERQLKDSPKLETPMETKTTWLSRQIESKVQDLRSAQSAQLEQQRQAEQRRISDLNKGLSQALGEKWLSNVDTKIENGVATFDVAGEECRLSKDGDKFLLNGSVISTPVSSAIVDYFAQKQVF